MCAVGAACEPAQVLRRHADRQEPWRQPGHRSDLDRARGAAGGVHRRRQDLHRWALHARGQHRPALRRCHRGHGAAAVSASWIRHSSTLCSSYDQDISLPIVEWSESSARPVCPAGGRSARPVCPPAAVLTGRSASRREGSASLGDADPCPAPSRVGGGAPVQGHVTTPLGAQSARGSRLGAAGCWAAGCRLGAGGEAKSPVALRSRYSQVVRVLLRMVCR